MSDLSGKCKHGKSRALACGDCVIEGVQGFIAAVEKKNKEAEATIKELSWDGALNEAEEKIRILTEALTFYADGCHFQPQDETDWDSVSGEPENFYENDTEGGAGGVTVENGWVAKHALNMAGNPKKREPYGWLSKEGKFYKVKQRDDAGFGDFYPDQIPLYKD